MRGWGAVGLVLIGCTPGTGGRVEATWTGAADTGQLAAPAVAEWCAAGKYVAIVAARGDTGFAVAIASGDSVRPGRYDVAEAAGDTLRDGAALALRWPKETSMRGFQGDKGTVVLRRDADGTLSGEVDASGRLIGAGRPRLDVDATFRGVRVRPAAATCGSSVDSGDGDDVFPEGIRP